MVDRRISPLTECLTPMGDCDSEHWIPRQQYSATMSQSDYFYLTPLDDRHVSSNSPATSVTGSCCHNRLRSIDKRRLRTTGKNNSATFSDKYICPILPEGASEIGPPLFVENRVEYRMAMRPDKFKYVTLTFRVMRYDAELHVGQLVNLCSVKRSELYTPWILDRWTQKLQVKLKASVKVSVVFRSISARLGLQSTVGIKYCLDGFFGIEAFGDAFGNNGVGVCPWMEVTGDGSPISLRLEDGDNIYVSVANEKMGECARRRAEQVSENMFKQAQQRSSLHQSGVSVRASDTADPLNLPMFDIKRLSFGSDVDIVELAL